jgi:ribosomal protein S18
MPYLHWEIKSRQIKMAEAIVDINRGKKKISTPANREKNKAKKEKNEKEKEDVKKSEKDRTDPDWARLQYLARFKDETGRVPEERSKHLGEYLMSIARLSEAMDYEADERLLRDFLHEEPPLHVRRTLDQSYFWTLQDTASRDRDQVVYRGTRGGQRPQGRIVMVDQ